MSPTASADSQRLVSLYVDGQKKLFPTDASTVGEVLKRANVKLGADDLVEPSAGTTMSFGQYNINVYRARPVEMVDGVHSYYVHSAYQSPRLLALTAGLNVYPEDKYRTEIITNIVQNNSLGEKVTVLRAKPFTVNVDGSNRHLRTQADTVGDALKGADISLGLKDTVSAPPAAKLLPGATITITRVTEAVVTLTQNLPRPVQNVNDPNMLKGQTAVQNPGSDGQKTVTYRIHYQNGVETSRETLQVVSQTAPVAEVISVGTKVVFAGSVEYWRPLVVAAAAQHGLDPNMMLRIMNCESHGNATDVNASSGATGLFQYKPGTWASAVRAFGNGNEDIMDGAAQIRITAAYMAANGTGAWACQ